MIQLKKLKKVFVLTLSTILMSLPLSAEASSPVPNEQSPSKPVFEEFVIPDSIVEVTINEYDEVMRLKSLTDEELKELGWSSERITDLRNINYEEELIKQLQEEKANLNNYRNRNALDEDIISIIKETDLSKELTPDELRAAAPKINLRGGVSAVDLDKDEQTWRYYYEWTWFTKPLVINTDIIGVRASGTVNGGNASPVITSASFAMTSYFKDNNTKWAGEYMSNFEKVDIGLAQAKFPLAKTVSGGSNGTLQNWIATSGYGYINFNNSKPMERLSIALQYGHSTLAVSPSIDLGAGLPPTIGYGFSFSSKVNVEAGIYATYNKNGAIVQ